MPRVRGLRQNFNFTKGWNTEASPLTYPENTASDLDNVILDIDGSVRRRPGLDFELNYQQFSSAVAKADLEEYAIGFHEWKNAAGSGDLVIAVTQVGGALFFHTLSGDETTQNFLGSTGFIPSGDINAELIRRSKVSVTSGMGYLFVTGRYIKPFRVTYNPEREPGSPFMFQKKNVEFLVRDTWGVKDDDLRDDERPKTATAEHIYSLLNAGWKVSYINTFCGNTVLFEDGDGGVIVGSFTATNEWPARSDIQYLGIKTDPETANLSFSRNEILNQTFGNTPAPQGHYLLDAFERDRAGVSGLPAVGKDPIGAQPEHCAFHNGRIFWAGLYVTDQEVNTIYFSQQLTDIDNAGFCYQKQDPTAEEFNDLLATDGGTIPIPNAGEIKGIVEVQDGVMIFATNGVWHLTGADGGTFSATSFSLNKVSEFGCVGTETIVNADENLFYWAADGIMAVARDNVTGLWAANDITQQTIQSAYLLIGGVNHSNAVGKFIREEKKVVWLHGKDPDADSISWRYRYNGVLVLDLQLGAFYRYTIQDIVGKNTPFACGIMPVPTYVTGFDAEPVTVGGVTVTVVGVDVTVRTLVSSGGSLSFWKILVATDELNTGNYKFTMGSFKSKTFHDWYWYDKVGVNYTSYLETGYDHHGRPEVDKVYPYVTTYMSKESKSLAIGNYYQLPAPPSDEPVVACTLTDAYPQAAPRMQLAPGSTTVLIGEEVLSTGTGALGDAIQGNMRYTTWTLPASYDVFNLPATPDATFDTKTGITWPDSQLGMHALFDRTYVNMGLDPAWDWYKVDVDWEEAKMATDGTTITVPGYVYVLLSNLPGPSGAGIPYYQREYAFFRFTLTTPYRPASGMSLTAVTGESLNDFFDVYEKAGAKTIERVDNDTYFKSITHGGLVTFGNGGWYVQDNGTTLYYKFINVTADSALPSASSIAVASELDLRTEMTRIDGLDAAVINYGGTKLYIQGTGTAAYEGLWNWFEYDITSGDVTTATFSGNYYDDIRLDEGDFVGPFTPNTPTDTRLRYSYTGSTGQWQECNEEV